MTNDVDHQLKQRILSEYTPTLPQGFERQTVDLLMQTAGTQPVLAQGHPSRDGHAQRSNWVMAFTLVLALSVAWKWGVDKMAEDDELMRVDTLSMSSLLVL